jgi:hypothetical protein
VEEVDLWVKRDRKEAWKKRFKEKLGREYISPVKGFVVAGCILDVIDDIWSNDEGKRIRDREELVKQHYNVYVYRILPYPPQSMDKKGGIFL